MDGRLSYWPMEMHVNNYPLVREVLLPVIQRLTFKGSPTLR